MQVSNESLELRAKAKYKRPVDLLGVRSPSGSDAPDPAMCSKEFVQPTGTLAAPGEKCC